MLEIVIGIAVGSLREGERAPMDEWTVLEW